MEISSNDLMALMSAAIDAGVQAYIRSVTPSEDLVSQSEAKRYLSRVGIKPSMLGSWAAASLITPVKRGQSRTAKVLYSLAEIKKVIAAGKLEQVQIKNL
jgi:hypothetical protein